MSSGTVAFDPSVGEDADTSYEDRGRDRPDLLGIVVHAARAGSLPSGTGEEVKARAARDGRG
jgi:hypothetical protein